MKMRNYAQLYAKLYPPPPSFRKPSEPHTIRFWMIEMATGGGYYIVLPGIYTTKVRAELNIPPNLTEICLVREYQKGRGTSGPERVNP